MATTWPTKAGTTPMPAPTGATATGAVLRVSISRYHDRCRSQCHGNKSHSPCFRVFHCGTPSPLTCYTDTTKQWRNVTLLYQYHIDPEAQP
ncbi:hypothetical protein SXCC_02123 [Gluconacetobacter sp. SXCC-1]|nr:hypothetical protein SXCC_02123 [Gluconacetobacter sp. SXCC-1]